MQKQFFRSVSTRVGSSALTALLAGAALLLSTACGQKGPLKLPQPPAAAASASSPASGVPR